MRNTPLQRRPAYVLSSVDNVLRLLQLLRDTGGLRNKDAAEELGIAASSANRLLSMLVYRGFAVQDETHLYLPGPALGEPAVEDTSTRRLKLIVQPHLEDAVRRFSESANLVIRVGTSVRFLSTVESPHPLRVGDRQGAVVEASKASGGKALLAELPRKTLERMYLSDLAPHDQRMSVPRFEALLHELGAVRRRGCAFNREGIETGVSAIGIAVHDPAGIAVGAVSLSAPSSRFEKIVDDGVEQFMNHIATLIDADLATALSAQ
jgi:IclR family acetate operon transcriptional repressor